MFEEEGICEFLQTRLEGIPLHRVMRTPDLLFRTGRALALLDLALAQVKVPAAHRPVLWHVGCWSRLMELEQYLPSGSVADCVRAAMAEYLEFVEPQISNVVWQVTHNDPSPFAGGPNKRQHALSRAEACRLCRAVGRYFPKRARPRGVYLHGE
jgi:hypothetical protein